MAKKKVVVPHKIEKLNACDLFKNKKNTVNTPEAQGAIKYDALTNIFHIKIAR